MTFLPDDYKIPKPPSNYTTLQEGLNHLRIMSDPIIGWERWADVQRMDGTKGRGPIRVRMNEELDVSFGMGGEGGWKHFWAMIVWNEDVKRLQIWEVTQKGIMNSLKALSQSTWGNPKDYTIIVNRTKTGPEAMNVEYNTMPAPEKKPISEETKKAFENTYVDLEALFDGADPFGEVIKPEEVEDDGEYSS